MCVSLDVIVLGSEEHCLVITASEHKDDISHFFTEPLQFLGSDR